MNRSQSAAEVDKAINHLVCFPDVLVDLAAGRRVFKVATQGASTGSIAFSSPRELSVGWREFARASDLLPFQIAIAKVGSSFKKFPMRSMARTRAERFGWLLVGLARSAYLLVDLHQAAINAEVQP